MSRFQKAVKTKCKARIALYGPSGGGKTYTALRIATGLGGRIGLIDTENFSASKYADRFSFDTLNLEKRRVEDYVSAINDAREFDVLIIDSASHAWEELVVENDKLAAAKHRGNTWAAWSDSTPRHKALVDAIQTFPGHILVTMRSKTEWAQEQGNGGKSKPVRVGLAPEQRKGIEYEFDIVLSISVDHVASVEKDRSGRFQDQIIEKPGEEFGKSLADWLSDGAAPPPPTAAKQIAAQHGMTTADKLPAKGDKPAKSAYQIACEGLDTVKTKERLKLAEDWISKQKPCFTEAEWLQLAGKIADADQRISEPAAA